VLFPMYIIAIVSIILIQGTCASRGTRLAEHYDACLQGKDSMLGQLDKMMVYGIGVGAKEVGGKPLDQLAIRFYVHEKIVKPRPDIAIPSEINGCPTDVIVTPPFKLYGSRRAPQSRHRPVIGGVSIGTFDADSYGHSEGTLGVIIQDNRRYIGITAAHVLEIDGKYSKVVQPASDNPSSKSLIGVPISCDASLSVDVCCVNITLPNRTLSLKSGRWTVLITVPLYIK